MPVPSHPAARAVAMAAVMVAMACGYSERMNTTPWVAPTPSAAMVIPSIRLKGSPSMTMRSAKVPLSPSSALQTMYFWSALASATVFHLMPVGKPAPPRPRRPDSVTSATMAALSMVRARRRPASPPWAS